MYQRYVYIIGHCAARRPTAGKMSAACTCSRLDGSSSRSPPATMQVGLTVTPAAAEAGFSPPAAEGGALQRRRLLLLVPLALLLSAMVATVANVVAPDAVVSDDGQCSSSMASSAKTGACFTLDTTTAQLPTLMLIGVQKSA